ncbi:MAG TPA: HupE/UreJ family protein [Steroidobacter sp.]|uniref:HupE/UreJ family protein n=1 Tax=Steroidobacter sp. TaxID=1978227 RepID=UPI002ED80778
MMLPGKLLRALGSLLLIGVLTMPHASAHEVRPAFLEIIQSAGDSYRVVWKQPTQGDQALRLIPHISNGWLERAPEDQYAAAGFLVRTWNIRAGAGETLDGSTIAVEGLRHTITDVLVRIQLLDHRKMEVMLRPENPEVRVMSQARAATMPVFFVHGIEHILAGVDHLVFVLGLLLIVRDRWMLLKAITAFTVAHSITLAASMVANVSLPGALVETLIALSILFLGLEVLRAHRVDSTLTIRHPWAVAFFFGLFHGMGFAGGLAALGFAANDLFAALVFFNLGVEAGQLAFITVVLVIARSLSALRLTGPMLRTTVPAYVVGIAGAYWSFQTATALLGIR